MRWSAPLGEDRRAVAALEFALLAPVLIVVALSLLDITNAITSWWQLAAAADAIGRIATTYAATENNSNSLSTTQAVTASTAVFAVVPALASAPLSRYGVTLSSIVMAPTSSSCSGDCTYVANTAWSLVLQGTGAARPCGTLAVVPDGQPSSPSTLAADAYTASPVLVVDVSYEFAPLFTTIFGTGLRFTETAYMPARTGGNADWVHLTGPNAAHAQCPGYTG